MLGIPCRHAVAAINYKVETPEDYVHAYYNRDAYQASYGPQITPINGQQLWPKTNQPELLPPIYKTPPGRPKKLRRREADEHVNHSKLSKKNTIIKCSKCNQLGHNTKSCRRGIRNKKVNAHLYYLQFLSFLNTTSESLIHTKLAGTDAYNW